MKLHDFVLLDQAKMVKFIPLSVSPFSFYLVSHYLKLGKKVLFSRARKNVIFDEQTTKNLEENTVKLLFVDTPLSRHTPLKRTAGFVNKAIILVKMNLSNKDKIFLAL